MIDNSNIEVPYNAIGFIYKLYNPLYNKTYYGKKHLLKYKTIDKKKVYSESDWETYYSSNKFIKDDIKINTNENWYREILCWCYSEKELTYREMEYQIKNNVLEDENNLNDNILGKFYRKDLIKK